MKINPHFEAVAREVLWRVPAEPRDCPAGLLTCTLPYRSTNLRISVRAWLGQEGLDL